MMTTERYRCQGGDGVEIVNEGDADLQRCHGRVGMLVRWVDNDAIEGRDKTGRQAALVATNEKLEIVVIESA